MPISEKNMVHEEKVSYVALGKNFYLVNYYLIQLLFKKFQNSISVDFMFLYRLDAWIIIVQRSDWF